METQVFSSAQIKKHLEDLSFADDQAHDLGFQSETFHKNRTRLINKDGSFNVHRRGYSLFRSHGLYHCLLNLSWPKFLAIMSGVYFAANMIFATLFFLCGPAALRGLHATDLTTRITGTFFFSVQTLATIGYGVISPNGFLANLLVSIEAFAGMLGMAMITGLCFARFSRPTARLRFSRFAVIAPSRNHAAFQFRVVNERSNQIVNLEARIVMSRLEREGSNLKRRFYDLALERRQVLFFPLHWTVAHLIDASSPLYGMNAKSLAESNAEFLVLLNGTDDTFSQTVHARTSYKFDEVVWGAKFVNILEETPTGTIGIDLRRVHDIAPARLDGADAKTPLVKSLR